MTKKASEIIAIAKKELGTKESPPNSNRVKYCTVYGVITAWCVIFLWWCFREAGASEMFYSGGKCASCSVLMAWAKSRGQWVTKNYAVGDLLLYDWNGDGRPEHIGICTAVNGNNLTAIEGNTAIGNNSDGGEVMTRSRKKSQVLGAFRPKYTAETTSAGTPNKTENGGKIMLELSELSVGSKGTQVRTLQRLLKSIGIGTGSALKIDGDFGSATKTALIAYQKSEKLTADGICGAKTWARLIKGA